MKRSGFIILFHLCVYVSIAQSVSTQMGGRATAMGCASATLADEWSLFNNVGGLGATKQPAVAAAQEICPSIEGGGRTALSLATPLRNGVAGIGVFRFGDPLYNEQIVSAAYGDTRGLASLGMRVSFVAYHADGYRDRRAFAISFGGIATLTPKLKVGAYITNLNQPMLSKETRERLPLLLTAGISFRAAEHFLLTTEIQKDLDYNPTFRCGIEFELHPQIIFRTGFNMHPSAAFLGVGFIRKKMKIDYAMHYTGSLGPAHHISVICRYGKTKSGS